MSEAFSSSIKGSINLLDSIRNSPLPELPALPTKASVIPGSQLLLPSGRDDETGLGELLNKLSRPPRTSLSCPLWAENLGKVC